MRRTCASVESRERPGTAGDGARGGATCTGPHVHAACRYRGAPLRVTLLSGLCARLFVRMDASTRPSPWRWIRAAGAKGCARAHTHTLSEHIGTFASLGISMGQLLSILWWLLKVKEAKVTSERRGMLGMSSLVLQTCHTGGDPGTLADSTLVFVRVCSSRPLLCRREKGQLDGRGCARP